jgi:hypothetical protein
MKNFTATKRSGRSKDMTWRVEFKDRVFFDGEVKDVVSVGFGATKEVAISECMTILMIRMANMANKSIESKNAPAAIKENNKHI